MSSHLCLSLISLNLKQRMSENEYKNKITTPTGVSALGSGDTTMDKRELLVPPIPIIRLESQQKAVVVGCPLITPKSHTL